MKLVCKFFFHVLSHFIRGHSLYPAVISNQSAGLPSLEQCLGIYCRNCNMDIYLKIKCNHCDKELTTDVEYIKHVFQAHGVSYLSNMGKQN